MSMKTTLSERLTAAMKANGDSMSQEMLARLADVSQPTINRLLTGKADGSSKIVQIATALGVNPTWLAMGVGEMHGQTKNPELDVKTFINKVPVWNLEGKTEEFVIAPKGKVTSSWRAYNIDRNSGCRDVKAGSLVYVDTAIHPGTGDLVMAKYKENISAYYFLSGGERGFLSVDDTRIPLIDIAESAEIIGVVIFVISDLRR